MSDNKIDAFKLTTWEERGGEYVRRLARDLGLTVEQAAGIVGNLGYESVGFTKLQEIKPAVSGSRGGYGVAQWTGPRRRAFEAWCATNSLTPSSDEANYGFLVAELSGPYRATIREVIKTTSLDAAVFSVGQTYERPGGTTPTYLPGFSGRMTYAERALAGAGSGVGLIAVPPIRPAVERVKAIQEVLAEGGLYAGAVDGVYGRGSAAAMNALARAAMVEKKT